MSHSILLASAKGGCGKTTTALNLAVTLAERGHATLLVDLDPQGGVGLALAKPDTEWIGLAEYLTRKAELKRALLPTKINNLAILPRGKLSPVDVCEYENLLRTPDTLGVVLKAVATRFQYVIVDAPSGLGMITRSAMSLVDFILVPLQAEPLALRSVGQALMLIEHVQTKENPKLQLLGLLPTMVQLDQDTSLNVMGSIWSQLSGVMETHIPRAESFAVASQAGVPVAFLGGTYPPEARRFELLAAEIEDKIRALTGKTGEADERPQRQLV